MPPYTGTRAGGGASVPVGITLQGDELPTTLTLRPDVGQTDPTLIVQDEAGVTVATVDLDGAFVPTDAARREVVVTTGSLADEAEATGNVALGSGYRLLRVATDVAARVQLYTTAAKRTADDARAVGEDPTGDHGLVLDLVTTADMLSVDLSPVVDGYELEASPDGAVPYRITNLSGSTDTVAVTFTYVPLEAS